MSGRKVKRRRLGRGAVMLIVGLLLASGVLRIGIGATQAVAAASVEKEGHESASEEMHAVGSETHAEPMAKPNIPALNRTEMGSLLEALKAREEQVAEREAQMNMRAKALQVADEEITKRLKILEQAEAALRATLTLADGAAEDDLVQLTTVYENMKPKDAAALFEAMEPGFAAGFLARMRPGTAAAVMAGLSPEAAYTISVILAGRNATVPKT